MPLQVGDLILNGKYRILKLIGEGAFSRVWLAEEPEFGGRCVAIKEPRTGDLGQQEQLELERRFRQETSLVPELEKAGVPNLVRTITLERLADGTQLLVMEYLEGGSLADLIAAHPNGLPVERAVAIAQDVLRALAGFHRVSSAPVHRDIKPENTLLDSQGRARLADLGLAQLAGMSGRSHLVGAPHPGTPLYMAPEQGRSSDPLTPAADLYALGCVLFEMLTGRRYKRVRPGTRAGSLRIEIPAWLDDALSKALVEEPWDRWQSAEEVEAALATGMAHQQAEEQARREAEAQVQRQAEEQARREAGAQAQHEAEERTRREAEAQAQRQAEEQARREADALVQREAMERERQARLVGLYEQLLARERSGDWAGATELAHQIEAEQPGYRDVAKRLAQAGSRLSEEAEDTQRQLAEVERRASAGQADANRGQTLPAQTAARQGLPRWIWIAVPLLGVIVLVIYLSPRIFNPGPTAAPPWPTDTQTFAPTETQRPISAGVPTTAPIEPTAAPDVPEDLMDQVLNAGELIVSTDPNYAPQSFLNDKGELDGFDVDVAKEVTRRLGVELIFVTPDWDMITGGHWGGRWDVSIGSMPPTEDRAQVLWFTDPYYYTPASFAVHKDNTTIKSPADLAGKSVGLGTATTYEAYLTGSLKIMGGEVMYNPPAGVNVKPYTTDAKAIQDLALGDGTRLDAVMSAQPTIQSAIASGVALKYVGTPAFYEPLAFALDKSRGPSDGMLAELNDIIKAMHDDGTLTELSLKWYGVDLTKVH